MDSAVDLFPGVIAGKVRVLPSGNLSSTHELPHDNLLLQTVGHLCHYSSSSDSSPSINDHRPLPFWE